MLNERPNNLLDIDSLIKSFIKDYQVGIATIHRMYFKTSDALALQATIAELMDELRTGCVSFFNKEYQIEELNSYLFYIVNAFCKKRANALTKKTTDYLCPGCLFLGKTTIVSYVNRILKCDECASELKEVSDPKKIRFYQNFFQHNKQGYRCPDCERFIPHPIEYSPILTCPYFDCCFVGPWNDLAKMHHPSTQSNKESLTLDTAKENGGTMHDITADASPNSLSQLEEKQELQENIKFLHEIIDYQRNNVPYSSSEFTAKHKILIYNAFENLLQKYPLEMVDYLINAGSSGYAGLQHKIFQEYVSLLENSLPITYKKGTVVYKVESLLDPNLTLFDGISIFEAIVTDKGAVKNGTNEFYIGGRKGAIAKPYYIGKLLSITDKKTKEVLIDKVVEYSFSVIKTRDIMPGTEVIVSHLRVPPHYQMGGMSYINRIRKKIIERINLLSKNNDL